MRLLFVPIIFTLFYSSSDELTSIAVKEPKFDIYQTPGCMQAQPKNDISSDSCLIYSF
jgi:hypothetical protein